MKAFRVPNTNTFVERFIQSSGQECLDRFVILGEQHMDDDCQEYIAQYHEDCPHQWLENVPIATPNIRRYASSVLTTIVLGYLRHLPSDQYWHKAVRAVELNATLIQCWSLWLHCSHNSFINSHFESQSHDTGFVTRSDR